MLLAVALAEACLPGVRATSKAKIGALGKPHSAAATGDQWQLRDAQFDSLSVINRWLGDQLGTGVLQQPLKFRRRTDNGPRGAAQAIDCLRGQDERGRQVVQVLDFRRVLERRERHVDGIKIDVRSVHQVCHRGILVACKCRPFPNLGACVRHRSIVSRNSSIAS